MTQTADFIIVGAGIAGISAAARLAAHGRPVVLEREAAPGMHATGRSAAMFIRNYGNATLRALNAASAKFLEEPDGTSESSLLSPRGELLVAEADETEAFDAYCAGATGLRLVDGREAAELFPLLRPERVVRAAYEPDAHDIDTDRLLGGFIRQLRGRGGAIETGAEVLTIERAGSAWRLTTPKGTFEAPYLVNAAGAWADGVAGLAGVRPVGLQPRRRTAAIVPAPPGHDMAGWPLCASAAERWYAKPEAGRLFVSPADETPVEPHDAYADDLALAEGLHAFAEATTYEVTRVERTWAGLRTFAPDRTPVAGFAPDADGFFWLAGQGGYGIQTAPALSQLAADLIVGGRPALARPVIAALSPSRFSA